MINTEIVVVTDKGLTYECKISVDYEGNFFDSVLEDVWVNSVNKIMSAGLWITPSAVIANTIIDAIHTNPDHMETLYELATVEFNKTLVARDRMCRG